MHISINGEPRTCAPDTTFEELSRGTWPEAKRRAGLMPILAYENGRLRELFHHAHEGDEIRFVDVTDPVGYETMRRSASMLFFAAADQLFGKAARHAELHFAIGNGFYYTFGDGVTIDSAFIKNMTSKMRDMVDARLHFEKRSVSTAAARDLFASLGMEDKEKLFRTRMASRVNVYSLGTYEDYNYGFMAYDTSVLGTFELLPYRDGVILNLPPRSDPGHLEKPDISEKLIDAQTGGEEWARRQGIGTVGALNARIISGGAADAILVSEAMQEGRIAEIASEIAGRRHVKFVMVAGPSSSGKTTFSQRLCIQLRANGLIPHYIGLDNYFVNRDTLPVGPDGKRDFESLSAIDVAQFNADMEALLEGRTVKMPTFDFIEGKRVYRGDTLSLGRGELLVIEGIHGLNDEMSGKLPKESRFRIYISALTQLGIDEHNRIPTADGRLLRRIVRDNRTRGYSASQTLAMWESVRRGEERNIFPFQESADVFFNSALPYEIAALKIYAEPLLFQVSGEDPSYQEAKRLLKFLDYFLAIPPDDVPVSSLLREFIGGGCFRL